MRYVGMDVHKRRVQVCVLDASGRVVMQRSVACTREQLHAFCRAQLRPEDQVAVDATTNSWAVVEVVERYVARVVVSNPLRTKAIAQAKIKTDKIDARVLADLLRCDYLPDVWQPDSHARAMLTQAAQHAGNHPGPLGAFFRRLARRAGRQKAISATARKLVTIAT